MATWPQINRMVAQYGRRAVARTLHVSDGTVRAATEGRADRSRVSQMHSRRYLVQQSEGLGDKKLRAALEADRASHGGKVKASSTPRGTQSRNAPRAVHLPGILKGATQIGREGGHELYRSQVEQFVEEQVATIGTGKTWHVAVHGEWLDTSGRYTTGDPSNPIANGWYGARLNGATVKRALDETKAELDATRERVAADMARLGRSTKEIATEKRRLQSEFASRFASKLFIGPDGNSHQYQRVDAIYIREATPFRSSGDA